MPPRQQWPRDSVDRQRPGRRRNGLTTLRHSAARERGPRHRLRTHRQRHEARACRRGHGRPGRVGGVDAGRLRGRGAALAGAGVAPGRALWLRVAVHETDILVGELDIYGPGVNLTTRLMALARPGEVVVSDLPRDRIDDPFLAHFTDLGPCYLKHGDAGARLHCAARGGRFAGACRAASAQRFAGHDCRVELRRRQPRRRAADLGRAAGRRTDPHAVAAIAVRRGVATVGADAGPHTGLARPGPPPWCTLRGGWPLQPRPARQPRHLPAVAGRHRHRARRQLQFAIGRYRRCPFRTHQPLDRAHQRRRHRHRVAPCRRFAAARAGRLHAAVRRRVDDAQDIGPVRPASKHFAVAAVRAPSARGRAARLAGKNCTFCASPMAFRSMPRPKRSRRTRTSGTP